MSVSASIVGKICEYYSRKPVAGAVVIANGRTVVSDANGRFSLLVPLKSITVRVAHQDFYDYSTVINTSAARAYDIGTITLQSKIRALR